jgi:hypothetical protein
MNRRPLAAALAAAVLLSTAAFLPSPQGTAGEDTELTTHMKAINTATRKLRTSLKDPARNEESLASVLEVEQHIFAAKSLQPQRLQLVPEAERKQFLTEFRKDMIAFLGKTLELELAICEGKQDAAEEALKELLKLKNPAHKKFQVDDKGDKEDK